MSRARASGHRPCPGSPPADPRTPTPANAPPARTRPGRSAPRAPGEGVGRAVPHALRAASATRCSASCASTAWFASQPSGNFTVTPSCTGSVDGWSSSRSVTPARHTTMQACRCREARTHSRPGLQVERGGVGAAGQRVQDDRDVVLAALEPVRRVHGDVRDAQLGQRRADRRGLVAVGRADGDPVGGQRRGLRATRSEVAAPPRSSSRRTTRRHRPYRLGVGARGVPGGQLQQAPARLGRLVDHPVRARAVRRDREGEPPVAVVRCRCGTGCTGRTRRRPGAPPTPGSRQDTGSRCCGSSGLWASRVVTAEADGSYDRPAHCSLPTIENGSSCPGSPTNSARSNSPATAQQRVRAHLVRLVDDRVPPRLDALDVRPLRGRGDHDVQPGQVGRLRRLPYVRQVVQRLVVRVGCRCCAAGRPAARGSSRRAATTRSSTCAFVCATTISGRPAAASSSAARTTSVDFPAPGGESTTTPRCVAVQRVAQDRVGGPAGRGTGVEYGLGGGHRTSSSVTDRQSVRRRAHPAARRASTVSPPGRAASRRPAGRARRG